MAVADALPEFAGEDEIPSVFPFGGSCPRAGDCGTLRRTAHLPAGIAAEFQGRSRELLPAAALILARKYANTTEFRIGVRRASWPGEAPSASLAAVMPATLTAGQHRRAVAGQLAGIAAAPGAAGAPVSLVCVLDGPADGRYGADLALSLDIGDEHTVLHLDCHEHVHDAAFAERMLGHLVTLLRQFAERPDTTVADLQLLTSAERSRLRELNGTRRSYPADASVHALFAEQAAAGPDRVAVRHADGDLTYRELAEQAERLAEVLYARGVRRGDRVAFTLEKTPRLLVAVLAVLRLGAAYVPIGTDLPPQRRDYLIADSGACLLLAEDESVTAVVPVLDLSRPPEAPGGQELPEPVSAPQDAAYVMYTSGTTGRPKGVLVNQRAVVRLVRGADYVSLSPETRILQTGAIAFDATTFEFWGALLNGGTVVLVPGTTVLNAEDLGAAVRQYRVNTLFLTTALFHQIVEQDSTALAGCQVLVGGETMSARHLGKAMDACPDSTFVHVYGPTENTTFSVAQLLSGRYTGRVPIGRPIANSTACVLDRDGNPQPLGVPGELHVGGDGLSEGYVNRADLNETAFVHGGAGRHPERLYRTGDIALWTADGQLDFIGRADHQVKIRGYRVELAEVESQLTMIPGVREAAVLLRRRAGGVSVLCAYYSAETAVGGDELRAALLDELPDYMVPSSFTRVDSMPLTRNQKIDRAALAALEPADTSAPAELPRQAPRTPREATVAGVFAEVLGLASVSVDDNFFDLGGHSLLATRLWSRLRSELGVEFPLRQILDTPTVAGLVASLERESAPAVARPKLVRRSS